MYCCEHDCSFLESRPVATHHQPSLLDVAAQVLVAEPAASLAEVSRGPLCAEGSG